MIDASIPLQSRGPQFEDPMQQYGKVLGLKNLMQQNQAGALGLEREQMQNQLMHQDMADQQLMKEAYGQSGGDLDKLPGMLAGKVSPKTLMALNASILEHRQKMAALSKEELAVAKGHTEAIGSGAQAILSAPPEQRAAIWPTVRAGLLQGKHGTEADLPAEYPGDQWVQTHGQMAIAADKQIEQALAAKKETREQTESTAKVPGLVAKSQQEQLVTAAQGLAAVNDQTAWDQWRAGLSPDLQAKTPPMFSPAGKALVEQLGMTAEQRTTAAGNAAVRTESQRHDRVTEGLGAGRLNVERQRLGMEFGPMGGAPGMTAAASGVTGEEFLKSLPPAVGQQVKALAEGRMQFPSGMALSKPYWQNMLRAVGQYDPSFDAVNYNARSSTRRDFTSGSSAKQVNALNTVIGHLNSLSESADALHNTSMPIFNSVGNWLRSNTGDPRVKQFDTTKKAVVDELTRVWRGSGGSEGDIKSWASTLDAANSPAQLHGVIAQMGDLLESKISSMSDQYAQGMGTSQQGLRLLTPQSETTLQKLEGKTGRRRAPAAMAPAPVVAPTAPTVGKIAVISPEGVPGFLDADKWAAAQARGFKRQ